MAEVNLSEKRQSIEIYVEGKLYGSIVINPSVPNGCSRIYEALVHEREQARLWRTSRARTRRRRSYHTWKAWGRWPARSLTE